MNRYLPLWVVATALVVGCQPSSLSNSEQQNFGSFQGDVVAVWDADGRNMTLRETFIYTDAKNRQWVAPAGTVVNGASIPSAFWSVIGGPFEGKYRNASVVHDIGCEQMQASWEDVHRMFYEACRCGGVEESQAKMLYYAVYHFGPRWKPCVEKVIELQETSDGRVVEAEVTVEHMVRIDPPPPTPAEIEQVAAYVAEENPQPEEMRTFSREALHHRPRGGYGSGRGPGRSLPRTENARQTPVPPVLSPLPAERADQVANHIDKQHPGLELQSLGTVDRPLLPGDEVPLLPEQMSRELSPPESVPGQPSAIPGRFSRFANQIGEPDARPDISQDRYAMVPGRPAGGYRSDFQRPPLTDEEQQSVMNLVDQYITQQAGEPRPAQYLIERSRGGIRVQIRFLHVNESGEMVPTEGGECSVRVSRTGEVLEFVSGSNAKMSADELLQVQ